MYKNILLLIIVSFLFTACSSKSYSLEQRVKIMQKELKKNKNIQKVIYKTDSFDIFSLEYKTNKCNNLDVYIEGDGLSWIRTDKISSNPTPINPLAMKLFFKEKNKCSIYLARPCQYIFNNKCKKKYWTSHRFSSEIIKAYNEVLNKIAKNKSIKFTLIGYSGGATIASLVAIKRDDIKLLISVAGNLDTDFWTYTNSYTSLYGSLNPANYTKKLEHISQVHLIGKDDNIVSKEVFFSYYNKFKNKKNIDFMLLDGFTHSKKWLDNWNKILKNIKKNR